MIHRQTTDIARTALDAYTKLMRSAESVTGRISRHMAAAELTVSQFGVLEALLHKGPLCQRDIAAKILKSSGNITLVIDNLEKRDLVQRRRDSKDRRFITVSLTETGKQLITGLFPTIEAAIVEEIGVLSSTEQMELARMCRTLGRKGDG